MEFRDKRLYHQIHPLKLATDIGAGILALYFVWRHEVVRAVIVGFVPPAVVSIAMLRWKRNWARLQTSAFGRYVKRYMTHWIEAVRAATLIPMAYGAWNHAPPWIVLGFAILVAAWAHGLFWHGGGPA